ncbi:hypothetical protein CU664_18080 [Pseudomonas syringae pv. actinidifoliorum]|nr:hypothetical protein [Pseudomonas syringae pv. actinidifoliorum]NAT65057.1 hypothetical protein [Pseudomonas syringae pv. actinidifoliorum]
MPRYKNLGGDSGVDSYEPGHGSITVTFKNGRHRNYVWEASRVGQASIEQMLRLAEDGQGLNAYIHSHVHGKHSRSW